MTIEKLKKEIDAVRGASMFNAKPLADKALRTAVGIIEQLHVRQDMQSTVNAAQTRKINALELDLDALKQNIKTSALVEG